MKLFTLVPVVFATLLSIAHAQEETVRTFEFNPPGMAGGQLRLPPSSPWTINVQTGEVRIQSAQN